MFRLPTELLHDILLFLDDAELWTIRQVSSLVLPHASLLYLRRAGVDIQTLSTTAVLRVNLKQIHLSLMVSRFVRVTHLVLTPCLSQTIILSHTLTALMAQLPHPLNKLTLDGTHLEMFVPDKWGRHHQESAQIFQLVGAMAKHPDPASLPLMVRDGTRASIVSRRRVGPVLSGVAFPDGSGLLHGSIRAPPPAPQEAGWCLVPLLWLAWVFYWTVQGILWVLCALVFLAEAAYWVTCVLLVDVTRAAFRTVFRIPSDDAKRLQADIPFNYKLKWTGFELVAGKDASLTVLAQIRALVTAAAGYPLATRSGHWRVIRPRWPPTAVLVEYATL